MPASKPPAGHKKSPKPKAGSGGARRTPEPARTRPEPPITYVQPPGWQEDISAFLRRYGREIGAVALVAAGAALLLTLPGVEASWLERIFGWTAPLVALVLVAVGLILLLGRRAGYWSAEALLGAELLLLSLQAGTYVVKNPAATQLPLAGENGGIMGWVLGRLLLNGFGRPLALLFVALLGTAGVLLLIRYTPLIYVAAWLARAVPGLRRGLARLAHTLRPSVHKPAPAATGAAPQASTYVQPASPRFVEPHGAQPASSPEVQAGRTLRPSPLDDSLPPLRPTTGRPARPRAAAPQETAPAPRQGAAGDKPRAPKAGNALSTTRGAPLPPMELLDSDTGSYSSADIGNYEHLIVSTLEEFDTPVKVVHVESGPTVTQFGVEPLYIERAGQKRKVRVSRIVSLENDLALALAVPAVRIEAPVPGRPYVGIEVPNVNKSLVSLRGILESREFAKESGGLALPLGRNTSGSAVVMDLTRAPHMLIAGATGSGKSVCINAIIMGLLMRHSPDSLRLVMVDPKRVELTGYNGIPHLLGSVITDVDEVMPALTWLMLQMDDRYRLFREHGVRNITGYNALAARPQRDGPSVTPLPYLVLIVDELADLMMTAPEDIERQLCRLAQMARATGIHLILATQRPSVDVVTGLIKANFPTRVAFAVTSQVDSRVILDGPGAERLLGRGDMLLMRPDLAKLLRVQGCLVTDEEINQVAAYWKQQSLEGAVPARSPWAGLIGREEDADELVQQAMDLLDGMQSVSVSLLQRKLRLGYPRAARLMEQLETRGVVGPDLGPGQGREVLLGSDRGEAGDTREYDAGSTHTA